MDHRNRALALLPADWRQACRAACAGRAEELRLRLGRPPTALCGGREFAFASRLCRDADLACVLERASGASLHVVAGTLRRGYLSCGGLRIGVCGFWLPVGLTMLGSGDPTSAEMLQRELEAESGIPGERQQWIADEGMEG